jgi:hypothetical protein
MTDAPTPSWDLRITAHGNYIRDRPVLTIEQVAGWFVGACSRPSDDALAEIARVVNHLDIFKRHWIDEPKAIKFRKENPCTIRHNKIYKALQVVLKELPPSIATAKLVMKSQEFDIYEKPFLDYLDTTRKILLGLEENRPKGRGRPPLNWHGVARNLVPLVRQAFRSAGNKEPGFSSATGRGIAVLDHALRHLGVHESAGAIYEAVARKRPSKKPEIPPGK